MKRAAEKGPGIICKSWLSVKIIQPLFPTRVCHGTHAAKLIKAIATVASLQATRDKPPILTVQIDHTISP